MNKRALILAVVAVALALGLATSVPARAVPPVSWQPEPFDIAVPPGKTLPTTATLNASRDIPASHVEITPSLAQFVTSIEPATLPALTAGSEVTITLVFEVASGTPAGTYTGTLHLRQASGQGNGTQAKPLPLKVTVGDLLYPPDPGEAGKATLEGVDSDGDGIRDDVQRYIQLTHPDAPATRAGLSQYARGLQTALLVASNREESRRVAEDLDRADECLESFTGFAAYDFTDDLLIETLNTEARSRAYISFDHNLGGTITRIPIIPDPATCTFDINAVR